MGGLIEKVSLRGRQPLRTDRAQALAVRSCLHCRQPQASAASERPAGRAGREGRKGGGGNGHEGKNGSCSEENGPVAA